MRKPKLSKWRNIASCEGLLYFAQCLEEALCPETIDSYRAPSLNTHLNAHELRYLAEEYAQNHIPDSAMQYCIDELFYNITTDAVLTKEQKHSALTYVNRFRQQVKNKERAFVVAQNITQEIFSNYWSDLIKAIKKYVKKPKCKSEIRNLALSFASELNENDITHKYAYHKTIKYFFSSKTQPNIIDSADKIDGFLELFNLKDKPFTVIFKCDKNFEINNEHNKVFRFFKSDAASLPIPNPKAITELKRGAKGLASYIVANEVYEKEPHMAIKTTKAYLDTFRDISSFHNHSEKSQYSKCAITIDEADKCICINSEQNAMKSGSMLRYAECKTLLANSYKLILSSKHERDLRIKVLRSFDLHQAAASSSNAENQILDLWSAIEGFLPQPVQGEHRIEIFLQNVIPILTVSYPFKVFKSIGETIISNTNTGESCLDSTNGNSLEHKAAIFLCSEEFKDDRIAFYKNNKNDFLLINRCDSIRKHYENSQEIAKTYERHVKRLDWHLRRIYLVRNQIVHRARTLPYINSLIEHLHSYFDTTILTIVQMALRNPKRDMMQHFEHVIMYTDAHLSYLKKENSETKSSNAIKLIFGDENPFR